MTPLKSIRKFCLMCVGSAKDVYKCGGDKMFSDEKTNTVQCLFYKFRLGRKCGRPSVKVIRRNCLDCMGGSYKLVKNCESFTCPVYIFRLGTNPNFISQDENIVSETHS